MRGRHAPAPMIQTGKDIWKIIKSVAELLILLALLYIIIRAWTSFQEYRPFTAVNKSAVDYGFVSVSYTGVERSSSRDTIGVDRLEQHLKALHDCGYQTISQQDVMEYYRSGRRLPQKSLLLLFEDGNREASIFAQKIMEKYNYKATVLSFADGFAKKDPKMLNGKDMLRLEESTFWEIGTNGYRLHYINVFGQDGQYLGEMDQAVMNRLGGNAGKEYDHYLMDYLRDENFLTKESYDDMEKRISNDYSLTREAYKSELGYMPRLYAIVNPNTGMFGHNKNVSAVNGKNIFASFQMNLNRLGYSLNDQNNSVYDLTRTQPQPYWRTNHLLMRLAADTGQEMHFVSGEDKKAEKWNSLCGAAEFSEDEIILTTLPDGSAKLCFQSGEIFRDAALTMQMNGNKLGSQSVWLRADPQLETGIAVTISSNVLYIYDSGDKLFSLDLNVLDSLQAGGITSGLTNISAAISDITDGGGANSGSISGNATATSITGSSAAPGSTTATSITDGGGAPDSTTATSITDGGGAPDSTTATSITDGGGAPDSITTSSTTATNITGGGGANSGSISGNATASSSATAANITGGAATPGGITSSGITPSSITDIGEPGSRQLYITLKGNKLSVSIDNQPAAQDITVKTLTAGRLGLSAETGVYVTNQRFPLDNIYDGIFKAVTVSAPDGAVLFDNSLHGIAAFTKNMRGIWKKTSDWFIKHF